MSGPDLHPSNRPRNLIRRVNRARNFPVNTCAASRHVQMIGEALIHGKKYHMIDDEPEHVGGSLLSVVESLYKARTEIARLRQKLATHPMTFISNYKGGAQRGADGGGGQW